MASHPTITVKVQPISDSTVRHGTIAVEKASPLEVCKSTFKSRRLKMRKLLFQPLIGCVVTSLFIGYFSYAAVADRVEKLAPAIKAQHGVGTEEPPLVCNLERNQQAESVVTELLEQAKQYANSKNVEKAAETLIQAFQLAQPLKNPETKVNLLEGVGNDVPTYYSRLLGNIVDHYAAAGKKDRAAMVIRQVLQVTQTLGSGYSFVKTKTLAEIAGHYAAIGQAEQALKIISQSLETAKFIQGAEFNTNLI
jgi:tetratricopeptide (TPR) repeat protein